jgi:hypothetical protein
MRLGLALSALLFTSGILLPLLLIAWLAAGALIATSAGMTLVHSGSLEEEVFAGCVRIAAAVDVVVLVAICLAWIARLAKASFFTLGAGWFIRYPVPLSGLALLAALGAVTAFAGNRASAAAQYTTTIVVLANTYFFAVLTVAGTVIALHLGWSRFRSWTVASAYRTGAWTMFFTFAGLAGLAVQQLDWKNAPAAELRAQIDLDPLRNAESVIELQRAALCIAASEALEAGADCAACATAATPPECARALGR